MELDVAIQLITGFRKPVQTPEIWSDLGCGSGLFTHALAHFLSPKSEIYAIDKEPVAIIPLNRPGDIVIHPLQLDFVQEELPFRQLDGILMANSLHFVRDKPVFLRAIGRRLKAGGLFLFVEYDSDKPNPWVPFPLGFRSLENLFKKEGYTDIRKLGEHPSRYGRSNMYAAAISKK